jgi:hypothetical protein
MLLLPLFVKTLSHMFLFVYFISHISSNASCKSLAGILYICQVLLGILCHEYLHHIPTFFLLYYHHDKKCQERQFKFC